MNSCFWQMINPDGGSRLRFSGFEDFKPEVEGDGFLRRITPHQTIISSIFFWSKITHVSLQHFGMLIKNRLSLQVVVKIEFECFFCLKGVFQFLCFLQAETGFITLSRGDLDDQFVSGFLSQVVRHLPFVILFCMISDDEDNHRCD